MKKLTSTTDEATLSAGCPSDGAAPTIARRAFLGNAAFCVGGALVGGSRLLAGEATVPSPVPHPGVGLFPFFKAEPVSYLNVAMRDGFWAPRQRTTREVSVQWVTSRHDPAGGLDAFKSQPQAYVCGVLPGEMEHVKFIEAMASVVGVRGDPAISGLIDAWAKPLIEGQNADGYLGTNWPLGYDRPPRPWENIPVSHESYMIGNYIEAAIAYREATGSETMYQSAIRAADNMAALLDGGHPYTSGHPEIEQALMRLYGVTGDAKYLRLCGWLLDQRGHHGGRPSYGRICLDDIPVKDQRRIEGHAVMAAFLFNGATLYVGATGDPAYREAVLAVWDDFVEHQMYLHGAGGCKSARNEGYRNDAVLYPDDVYGESCSVFANFQWAHNLFHLTGEARYLDAAERMLYNAFYASLSLKGDASFYCNELQTGLPSAAMNANIDGTLRQRSPELATSCCPPNIVKLFNKVGGFFYSTDRDGIYVKHYGSCEVTIPWGDGCVKLTQETRFPWEGAVILRVKPSRLQSFTVRLRIPSWAKSHSIRVNGESVDGAPQDGWASLRREWRAGDRIELLLPMEIERITWPHVKGYRNRAALARGPIVYCLEAQDIEGAPKASAGTAAESIDLSTIYVPEESSFSAEHRPGFLGGVTVLRANVRQIRDEDVALSATNEDAILPATFVPYCVWGNRLPSEMRVWLGAYKEPVANFDFAQREIEGGGA